MSRCNCLWFPCWSSVLSSLVSILVLTHLVTRFLKSTFCNNYRCVASRSCAGAVLCPKHCLCMFLSWNRPTLNRVEWMGRWMNEWRCLIQPTRAGTKSGFSAASSSGDNIRFCWTGSCLCSGTESGRIAHSTLAVFFLKCCLFFSSWVLPIIVIKQTQQLCSKWPAVKLSGLRAGILNDSVFLQLAEPLESQPQ